MRQVVLDTETTGLDPEAGHRVIEIGCVELINRRVTERVYHRYFTPERDIDEGALEVHGITNEFLRDKPRFGDVAAEFLEYIRGAEVVIHNAPFDVAFLDAELRRLGPEWGTFTNHATVLDTLTLARELHPGQRNSLDALCKRYEVDNSGRKFHGALLDAGILADVYLAMTGGQATLGLDEAPRRSGVDVVGSAQARRNRAPLRVLMPSPEELAAHRRRLEAIDEVSGGACLWLNGQWQRNG
jgi:DNA polymerase-3 subunit epsilon